MRSARALANETGKHLFLATVTLALLVPVIWVFTSALRSIPDFFRLPPSFFPREWTLVNFAAVFTQYPQTRDYYLNSALISAAVVPLTMTICCLAGYGFARLEFPGRNQIFWALVVTMYMPIGIARIFSIYELTAALHLLDTRLGLILPYLSLSLPVYIFLLRGMFQEIPREIEEAARIDGASPLAVFLWVMLPLARNGITVVGVLTLIGVWGEIILARFLTTQNAVPLSYGLTFMQEALGVDSHFPYLAAVYSLSILPIVAVFVLLQPWFMKGLMSGALKF